MKIGSDERYALLAWNNDDGTRSIVLYVDGWPITCPEQIDEDPENDKVWTEMFRGHFRHLSEEEIRIHAEQRRRSQEPG